MKKRIGEIALYLLAPAAILITSPLLAQGLGPDGRGQLGLIQSVASFAAAFGALGQAEVLLGDFRRGAPNIRLSSRIAFAGAVLSMGASFGAALFLGIPWAVAVAGLFLIPVLNQTQIWRSVAIANRRLMLPALANGLGAAIRTGLIAALFFTGLLNPTTAIGAIQVALALGAALTMGAFAHRWSVANPFQRSAEDHPIRHQLVGGSPILVFTLLTTVTLRADVIVIGMLSSAEELGIFAAASALSMAVLSISGAFKSRAQAAVFSTRPGRGVAREALVVFGLGCFGAAVAFPLAPLLVSILLGPGYEAAIPLIRILAVASVALLLLDMVHGLLAALGARPAMVATALVGASATIVSLLLLVPSGGAIGAAWATLISYAAAVTVGFILVGRTIATGSNKPNDWTIE